MNERLVEETRATAKKFDGFIRKIKDDVKGKELTLGQRKALDELIKNLRALQTGLEELPDIVGQALVSR